MPELSDSDYHSFRKLLIITIAAVYFLILVGGIVRSTGSGMGCPDWPKCFGSWIPPTKAEQLPTEYKRHYAEKRRIKNLKIATFLRKLNFDELAVKIEGDKAVYEELNFNPVKTWIEYLNRLVGVVIGILIFAVLVQSLKFISLDTVIFAFSLLSFITVGLEGWLGSIVVSTNLLPFSVTVHMGLALVLLALLIYIAIRSDKNKSSEINGSNTLYLLSIICLLFTFAQVLLGTQVRENVDLVAGVYRNAQRSLWIEHLGNVFKFHRVFSIIVFLMNVFLIWKITNEVKQKGIIYRSSKFLSMVLLFEMLVGIIMSNFAIPPFTQPLHLLAGSLIIGVQLILVFYIFREKRLIQ